MYTTTLLAIPSCSFLYLFKDLSHYILVHFQFVSIYAAYLYDSVKLYAKALDAIIKEETRTEELTAQKLISIATNGTRIVAKMIQSSPYKSKYLPCVDNWNLLLGIDFPVCTLYQFSGTCEVTRYSRWVIWSLSDSFTDLVGWSK